MWLPHKAEWNELEDNRLPRDHDPYKYNKSISNTLYDNPNASRDIASLTEVQVNFEIITAAVLIMKAHQVAIALKMSIWIGVMNIPQPIRHYATQNVFDVVDHIIGLQIVNVPVTGAD